MRCTVSLACLASGVTIDTVVESVKESVKQT